MTDPDLDRLMRHLATRGHLVPLPAWYVRWPLTIAAHLHTLATHLQTRAARRLVRVTREDRP